MLIRFVLLFSLCALALAAKAETPSENTFSTHVVAEGLVVPWDMEFAPDGRLFISERDGRIRVWENGQLLDRPWVEVWVARASESGLMGIAVDPEFANNGFIYACYTYFQNEQGLLGNRIMRWRDKDGAGTDRKILLEGIPGAIYHDGCDLEFGPDGKLYASTGDARLEPLAQDPQSLAGKILRINADGSVPEDNPVADSPVWSLGHRNPQGLAWLPGSWQLYATEHGTGGVNEINIIEAGGNYGWPVEREGLRHPSFDGPLLKHDGPPVGAQFVTGERYPSMRGNLLFTTLATQDLRRLELGGPEGPVMHRHLVEVLGRLRAIAQGPDGYVYVATSNRDTRGNPRDGDDRIIRLELLQGAGR
jgi:glucose/arabinose dehydrogenase